MSKYSMHLLVCGGTSCHSSESDAIVCNLRDELEAKGLMDSVQVILTGCFGFCETHRRRRQQQGRFRLAVHARGQEGGISRRKFFPGKIGWGRKDRPRNHARAHLFVFGHTGLVSYLSGPVRDWSESQALAAELRFDD